VIITDPKRVATLPGGRSVRGGLWFYAARATHSEGVSPLVR